MTQKLLGWDDLKARGIPHSKNGIYRQIRQGKFPEPTHIGKYPAWPEEVIDQYIAALITQRDREETEAPNVVTA